MSHRLALLMVLVYATLDPSELEFYRVVMSLSLPRL